MNAGARAHAAADRKAQLIAASAALRRDLVAQLPDGRPFEHAGTRFASFAGAYLRGPVALGALALGLAVAGPRRVFRALRWAAVALPLHPVGRRVLSLLAERLLERFAPGASMRAPRSGGSPPR